MNLLFGTAYESLYKPFKKPNRCAHSQPGADAGCLLTAAPQSGGLCGLQEDLGFVRDDGGASSKIYTTTILRNNRMGIKKIKP